MREVIFKTAQLAVCCACLYLIGCGRDESVDYVYSYDTSCEDDLEQLVSTLDRAGIHVSYEIIAPRDGIFKSLPWGALVKISVGSAYSQEALVGLLNNFRMKCGPSQLVELPDGVFPIDRVDGIISQLNGRGVEGAHLIYIDNGKAIVIAGDS